MPVRALLALLTVLLTVSVAAHAADWPEQIRHEAEVGGYRLVDTPELNRMMADDKSLLILDVRPDYEYRDGHIPGAVNVEFDLGDEHGAAPVKLDRIRRLAGTDTSRPIVIYCRSLQCLRSAIAARSVAAMGYENVLRYAKGWFGWLDTHPELKPKSRAELGPGDPFPSFPITPLSPELREYLGLGEGEKSILQAIGSEFLLVQIFNSECPACVKGLETVKQYWNRVQNDPVMTERLCFVGIASHDCPTDAEAFAKRHSIPFPVFTDPNGSLHEQTGYSSLPVTFLLRKSAQNRWQVVMVKDGLGGASRFYRDMRSSVKTDF